MDERAGAIWREATAAAGAAGGVIPDSAREDLLPEVTNLVESPTIIVGGFDRGFLALPRCVCPKLGFDKPSLCLLVRCVPEVYLQAHMTPAGTGLAMHSLSRA